MSLVHDEARRDVRDHLETELGQAFRQLDRGIEAFGGRGRNRELDLFRYVADDLFLDSLDRDHFISRVPQQPYRDVAAAGVEDGSLFAPGEPHVWTTPRSWT
jgi:hypothetical protein